MTFDEFRRELSANKLRPAYLFTGDEDFLAEEGARLLLDAVLPGQEGRYCLVDLNADAGPGEIKRALFSPSCFGAGRVVRLREPAKLDGEALATLAEGLDKIPRGTHLIIMGEPDKRRQAARKLLERAAVVDCPAPKKNEAVAWALARASGLGLTLSPEAARLLVETVGPRLRAVATELGKVQTYLGEERKNVTKDDLAALLGSEREDNVFQLVEVCAAGRVEEALRILADLLALGEPEALLLSLLALQTRRVLLAGHLRRRGRRALEIAKVLGVPVFVAEKLLVQAGRLDFARCRSILQRILRADLRSKTGERDPRIELELAVLEMAGGLTRGSD